MFFLKTLIDNRKNSHDSISEAIRKATVVSKKGEISEVKKFREIVMTMVEKNIQNKPDNKKKYVK